MKFLKYAVSAILVVLWAGAFYFPQLWVRTFPEEEGHESSMEPFHLFQDPYDFLTVGFVLICTILSLVFLNTKVFPWLKNISFTVAFLSFLVRCPMLIFVAPDFQSDIGVVFVLAACLALIALHLIEPLARVFSKKKRETQPDGP